MSGWLARFRRAYRAYRAQGHRPQDAAYYAWHELRGTL